jgi:hypothetical protein
MCRRHQLVDWQSTNASKLSTLGVSDKLCEDLIQVHSFIRYFVETNQSYASKWCAREHATERRRTPISQRRSVKLLFLPRSLWTLWIRSRRLSLAFCRYQNWIPHLESALRFPCRTIPNLLDRIRQAPLQKLRYRNHLYLRYDQ